MKKRSFILSGLIIIVIIVMFFAIRLSTYDNSQSQCEYYKDAQRQQENIENGLNN